MCKEYEAEGMRFWVIIILLGLIGLTFAQVPSPPTISISYPVNGNTYSSAPSSISYSVTSGMGNITYVHICDSSSCYDDHYCGGQTSCSTTYSSLTSSTGSNSWTATVYTNVATQANTSTSFTVSESEIDPCARYRSISSPFVIGSKRITLRGSTIDSLLCRLGFDQ